MCSCYCRRYPQIGADTYVSLLVLKGASYSESPSRVDDDLDWLPAKISVDHVIQVVGVLQAGYVVPFGGI